VTNSFHAQDGRRIAYADSGGGGPAVLCLPGLTRNMADYADLSARLAPAHLEVGQATIIGTSRGGIIGMLLAATRPELVTALVLNDIGPVVERAGLDFIMAYIGLDPGFRDFSSAMAALRAVFAADFPDLSDAEWMTIARRSFADSDGRPVLNYDPRLRDATAVALDAPPPDLWQVFDALAGLAVLTIRGGNSNILSAETLAEMARRRPDMAHVTLANRGHVPFLNEAPALAKIDEFLERHAT
jgi:pimeloyl-ACP methyl ester carboxylesterase